MKSKTSELTGEALDWAVCMCERLRYIGNYAKSWRHCGPIIEEEWLDLTPWPNESREDMRWHCQQHDSGGDCAQYGPTPLIAAMRCYVASKLGDDVDVPEEFGSL